MRKLDFIFADPTDLQDLTPISHTLSVSGSTILNYLLTWFKIVALSHSSWNEECQVHKFMSHGFFLCHNKNAYSVFVWALPVQGTSIISEKRIQEEVRKAYYAVSSKQCFHLASSGVVCQGRLCYCSLFCKSEWKTNSALSYMSEKQMPYLRGLHEASLVETK